MRCPKKNEKELYLLYVILLLIVLFIGWSFLKAKARKHDSDKFQALRELANMERLGTLDEAPYPSWALESYPKQQQFVAMLVVDTRRKNIPDSFFLEMWNNQDDRKQFLKAAGVMERNNSSFEAQAMVVADMIIHTWSKTSNAEKQIFINDEHRIEL